MPDEVMAVAERLARLEATVATGFAELRTEIGDAEGRLRAEIGDVEGRLRSEAGSVESRLRVLIEASRGEQRLAAEGFGATLNQIEARLTQMHREYVQTRDHAGALQDHDRRIKAPERRQSDSTSTT